MKTYLLSILLLLHVAAVFGQKSSAWEKVYADPTVTVEVSIQMSSSGCSGKNKFIYRVLGALYTTPNYVNFKTIYKDCSGNPVYLLNSVSVGPDAELNKLIESESFSGTILADKYLVYKPALSTAPFVNNTPQPLPNDWGIGVSYAIISGRSRACTGESVYLTSKVVDNTSTVSYQWQTSPDGKAWTKMEGKTASDCRTAELNTTTWFRLLCKDAATGMEQPSNELTVTVADAVVNINGTSPVCKGGSAELSASSNEGVTGAGYRWQQSQDNATWNDADGGSTSAFKSAALNSTTYFRCVYKPGSGFCKETTSDVFPVKIAEPPVVQVTATENVCKGGSAALKGTVSGDKTAGTYQWQSYTGDQGWSSIGAQTGADFSTGPLFSTTNFRALFAPAIPGCVAIASNEVNVKITDGPKVTAKGSTTIIAERKVALRAKGDWTQPANYQWQQSIDGLKWTDMPGETQAATHPKVTSTTYYRCLYKSPTSGCEGTSNMLTVEMPVKQAPLSAYSDIKHWDIRSHNPKKLIHLGTEVGIGFNYQPMPGKLQQFTDSVVSFSAAALALHGGFVFHPLLKNYASVGFILSGDIGSTPMVFAGGKRSKDNLSIHESYLFSKFNAGTEVAFGMRSVKMIVKYNLSMQTHRFNRSEQQDGNLTKSYSLNEGLRKETIGLGFRVGTYSAIRHNREPFCADAMFTLSNDYRFNYGGVWSYKSISGWQLGFETGFWFQSYFRMSLGLSHYAGNKSYLYPDSKNHTAVYLTLAYCRDWFR